MTTVQAPPAASGLRATAVRWAPIVLFFVIAVVGTIITWNRVPGDHRDRVWAEDANIFLDEGLQYGPWAVLFNGYAGYQHFVPRIVVAFLLPVLDLSQYPVIVFAICSIITGFVAAAVFWLSRDIVPWLPARVALGLVTVILPLATQETVGNLADIHTYGMWLAPWLLLYRPKRWATGVGLAFVVFAVVATEIQAVFFFFLILFRLKSRDKYSRPMFVAFVIAAAIQLFTAVTGDRNTSNGPLSIPSTVIGWMINTVMPLVTADPNIIRAFVLHYGVTVAVVILIPITAAAVVAIIGGNRDQRLLTIALLLGSAAVYTGSAWANSDTWFMYAEEGLENIGRLITNIRYGVSSGMMLVAVVPIAAAVMIRRWPRIPVKVLSWGMVLGLLVILAHGATMTLSIRNWVDPWSTAVDQAAVECSSDGAPQAIELPVAPDRGVTLTCDEILEYTPDE